MNKKKYMFFISTTTFLGFIVFVEGVQDYPSKISTIMEWSTPMSVHDV